MKEASMAATIHVRVLDVVSIQSGDRPPALIGSPQQQTLLTMLVGAKGRAVCLDAIADELWPDERPARWRGCIATLAASLRKAAGDADFMVSTARGYTLHRVADVVHTDVEELHECLEVARAAHDDGDMETAEQVARRALQIYGSGPWTTDVWGWNEAAAEAARILATALLQRHAYVTCITELTPAMEPFDWHDTLWACLIYSHHRLGNERRARALAQRAKLAVGAITPLLESVERQLASPAVRNVPFSFAASA
jgi:hypothetical protein